MSLNTVHDIINALLQDEYQRALQSADWLLIAPVFQKSSKAYQNALITALSNHTGIDATTLSENLLNLSNLNQHQQHSLFNSWLETQNKLSLEIEHFQSRTVVKQLSPDNIHMTRSEWHHIIKRFNQLHRQHVSRPFLLNELSSKKRIDFDDMVAILSNPNPSRTVKRLHENTLPDTQSAPSKKRSRGHGSTEPFVTQSTTIPHPAGLEVKPLTEATPTKAGTRRVRSPGNTRYGWFGRVNGVDLHKAETPEAKRLKISSLNTENQPSRLGRMTFKATQASFLQRSGKNRPLAQRAIMGDTARNVFITHGDELAIEAQGRHYHWSHVIAFILGGEHNANNLVATTAAANYTMLEAIEIHLIDLLKNQRTSEISIIANPLYDDERSLIPFMLQFELTWQEKDVHGKITNHSEQFDINPRSTSRLSKTMRETLATLRASSQNEDAAEDSDDSWLSR